MQIRATLAIVSILFASTVLAAGQVSLEAGQVVFEVLDPGALAAGYCQNLHRLADCSYYHVEGVTLTTEGTVLELDNQRYAVEWSGPGYYLESGAILEPLGEVKAGLGGQRWLEVYPTEGKIHVSRAWKDQDGNHALSISDTLTLDTSSRKALKPLKVKDVRLHVRARLLPEPPEQR